MTTARPTGLRIEFGDGTVNPTWCVLDAMTDEAIEAARRGYEQVIGRSLPLSCKTGYPEFTVYQDGDEVGGG